MTVAELRKVWQGRVAPEDFWLLLEKATGKNRVFLLTEREYRPAPAAFRRAVTFLRRRERGEPVAYILGRKEFYGRPFLVNRHTLIPRPETEALVESALETLGKQCRKKEGCDVVDVGTGSGNIIISLAKEHRCRNALLSFWAGDISRHALALAKKNAARHRVGKKIIFVESDLLESFLQKKVFRREILVVTANLPYLSEKLYKKTSRDVRFEPAAALVSDQRGLGHSFHLLQSLSELARTKTIQVFLEISPEQDVRLLKWVRKTYPAAAVTFSADLSKSNRVAIIVIPPLPEPKKRGDS